MFLGNEYAHFAQRNFAILGRYNVHNNTCTTYSISSSIVKPIDTTLMFLPTSLWGKQLLLPFLLYKVKLAFENLFDFLLMLIILWWFHNHYVYYSFQLWAKIEIDLKFITETTKWTFCKCCEYVVFDIVTSILIWWRMENNFTIL